MIGFENPYNGIIVAGIVFPLAFILRYIGLKEIFPKLYSIIHPLTDYVDLKKPFNTGRILLVEILTYSILAMMIIAYMNPYYIYTETVELVKKGAGTLYMKAKPATILVIDVSGSMEGVKIERAKEALKEFIDEINHTLDIGLIAFDGQIVKAIPPTNNYTVLIDAINSLKADGGTMYSYPLNLAYDWLKPYRDFNITVSIVFASDGLPADLNKIDGILDKYSNANITIYGVFIGFSNTGYELIRHMSEETGGKAYQADKIDELVSIYKNIASTIKNTTVSNVTIEMHYRETVKHKASLSNYFLYTSLLLLTLLYLYTYKMYRIVF